MRKTRGKSASKKAAPAKKAGTKKKSRSAATPRTAVTDAMPPRYVKKMRDLLVKIWESEAMSAEFAAQPTAVFKRYGLLPKNSKVEIVPHFQKAGAFDVVIPPRKDLHPDDLMMLAHHLIRCCASC